MKNVFNSNLKNFLKNNNITQTKFAKSLNVSNASISNYLSGVSEPTISFLIKFKDVYNVSIDNFLSENLSLQSAPTLESQNKTRFIGNYIIYYYDSSSYLGRTSSIQNNVLKYGVVCVMPSGNKLVSYGCFLKDLNKAINLKNELDNNSNFLEINDIFSKYTKIIYNGKFENSATQIFIILKSFNDSALIILNNPPSNKKYIGGLGTVNSVSRGREHMPCIQYILVSEKKIDLPEGEIYNLLSIDVVDVNVHNETEKLLNLFKNLYLKTNENNLKLEEYQKKRIFEDSLKNIISDCLDANIFRYAKVSAKDDDEFFNLIKDEN